MKILLSFDCLEIPASFMFTVALFTVAKVGNQSIFPSREERIKMYHIHTRRIK